MNSNTALNGKQYGLLYQQSVAGGGVVTKRNVLKDILYRMHAMICVVYRG